MQLSNNFSLRELTKSDTAIRLGLDNTPNEDQIENLRNLTLKVLQPARDWFGLPIVVPSGFRSGELNRSINGAANSQHLKGQAADIECIGISNYELACWIRDNCEFDQLILEYYTPGDENSGWVHVSYVTDRPNRNEVLTIGRSITKRGLHK